MTAENNRLSERSVAGFVLSITVPIFALLLLLLFIPAVLRFSNFWNAINTVYIIIRFVFSIAALLSSVSGIRITRKEQIRGHRLAVAGTVISSLQLLICVLLLWGELVYGLSLPIESPPETTIPNTYTQEQILQSLI